MLFCVRSSAQLQQYAGEPEPLLRALRTFGDVYVLNLPADDPAAAVLRRARRVGRRPPARDAPRALGGTRLDRRADRACHAVRLVAAARRQRARGRARARAAATRPRGHRPGSVEPRPRPRRRTAFAARLLRRAARADRHRPGRADLPAQPDGRAGRRSREPLARACAGPIRRRARLRAGTAEPLVPRAPGLGGAHGRDLLLARAPRLSAGPGSARAAARARRRASRNESRRSSDAAAVRFPGRYELVPHGIDPELFAPAQKKQLVVLEWRQTERPLLRALVRELAQQPGWELVLLRTRSPGLPAGRLAAAARTDARAHRAHRRRPRRAAPWRVDLRPRGRRAGAPRRRGTDRRRRDRRSAGARRATRARRRRDGADDRGRRPFARTAPPRVSPRPSRRPPRRSPTASRRSTSGSPRRRRSRADAPPVEERDWIVADLHLHTNWSHDCSIDVDELLDHAEAEGLGAIAVTDHNVFGGALEAVEKAHAAGSSSSSPAKR